MKNTKIYKLIDPRDEKVKYVGKTIRTLEYRLYQHLQCYNKTKKDSWIKSLLSKNLEPRIELIEQCDEIIWEDRERFWIKFYKTKGDLKNMTEGGVGHNGESPSKQSNLKRSLSLKGRICKQETKDKIRNRILGTKRSEETKEKIRVANVGKKYDKETLIKKSKAVIMMSMEGDELKEFYSVSEAAREMGFSKSAISAACNGYYKQMKGFKWKFK